MDELTDALRRRRLGRDRQEPQALAPPAPPTSPPSAEPRPRDEPAIAACPQVLLRSKDDEWVARAVVVEGQHVAAECYRRFALRVRPEIERRREPTLLVTSALRQEGKTTTACNLALALATLAGDRRIALLDLDLHHPGVGAALGIHPLVGIESVLSGACAIEQVRIATDLPSLDVFALAKPRPLAHEVLAGKALPTLLSWLAASYDTVVIDSPPVLMVPDVALVAPHVSALVAVVRSGFTYQSAFQEMMALLPEDRLIGCFLNDVRLPRHARRYSEYDYAESDAEGEGVTADG